MTAKELVLPRIVTTLRGSIATATTTNLGSDINVATALGTNYRPLDRIVIIIAATTAGTTDASSFSVQDAPDVAGSIGTPATAITTTLPAAAIGNQAFAIGVQMQSGRPWLRVRTTRASGTTDTLTISAVILGIPHNL